MTENQKGERVFVDTWEIYRLHFGMEEWEYYIFHNEEYFADFHDYSRPAPPAPESLCEGCTAEDEMCGKVPSECYSRYQENIEKAKAHDAQVAKAAREHVLNAVLDGNAKRFCPSIDDTHYHCCDVEACIREIFKNYEESLRAQQGGVSE